MGSGTNPLFKREVTPSVKGKTPRFDRGQHPYLCGWKVSDPYTLYTKLGTFISNQWLDIEEGSSPVENWQEDFLAGVILIKSGKVHGLRPSLWKGWDTIQNRPSSYQKKRILMLARTQPRWLRTIWVNSLKEFAKDRPAWSRGYAKFAWAPQVDQGDLIYKMGILTPILSAIGKSKPKPFKMARQRVSNSIRNSFRLQKSVISVTATSPLGVATAPLDNCQGGRLGSTLLETKMNGDDPDFVWTIGSTGRPTRLGYSV